MIRTNHYIKKKTLTINIKICLLIIVCVWEEEMIFWEYAFIIIFIRVSNAINNGLGRTPQMGKMEISNSFRIIVNHLNYVL
jgi:hypothetical protein